MMHPGVLPNGAARGRRAPLPVAVGKAAVVLLCLALPVAHASAQAWTQPRGRTYTKVSFGSATASEQYAFDGKTALYIDGLDEDTYRDRSFYAYTEIGLTDDVTLVLTLPYKRTFIHDQAFRFRTFALGSAVLGLRLGLLPLLGAEPSSNALAAGVALTLPTGYTRNFAPGAGAGQVDAQLTLSFGHSFHPFPAYAQATGGYRHRSAVYALSRAVACEQGRDIDCTEDRRPRLGDELIYGLEAGVTPLDGGLLLQALAYGVWSVEAPNVGFTAINPIPTRQRYLKLGGGATLYPFTLAGARILRRLGLSLQYLFTPAGRNTIRSRDVFVGVEYQTALFR